MAKPRGYKPIKCDHCGKEFIPNSSNARFCSPACKKLGSVRKIDPLEEVEKREDIINREIEGRAWELLEDPGGDFRPGSLFHLADICMDQSSSGAVRECWEVGTVFKNRKTGTKYQVEPKRSLKCLTL